MFGSMKEQKLLEINFFGMAAIAQCIILQENNNEN